MELYEIVKTEFTLTIGRPGYLSEKTSVVTATMDKDMAERMLEIYKDNQGDNESYKIRMLKDIRKHEW